jgi:hypothetical protein
MATIGRFFIGFLSLGKDQPTYFVIKIGSRSWWLS